MVSDLIDQAIKEANALRDQAHDKRSVSVVITKLEEAQMWLRKAEEDSG